MLALEDGTVFEGCGFGARTESYGEVVFNTAITGYQEIFTDPSYAGQIVVLTAPQIGNYGSNPADREAVKPFIEGLVVREFSPIASNWRSEQEANDFLSCSNIPVGSDMDTRALVRHLRSAGVMRGVLSTTSSDHAALVQKSTLDSINDRPGSGDAGFDAPVTPMGPGRRPGAGLRALA